METIKEKNKIKEEQLFKVSRMKEVIKPTRPHKHSGYHEFIYLSDGAGIHTIDDVDYEVKPGSLFYLRPEQVHCWDFTQIPKGFVLIFKEEFLGEFNDVAQLLGNVPTYFRFAKGVQQLVKDFDCLYQEYNSVNTNVNIVRSLLNIVIYRVVDELKKANSGSGVEDVLVNKFRFLVDQHFKTNKEVAFYADYLGVNGRKLSKLCKQDLGRPASSVISERLVKESKRLLRYTSNSISEIAFELKFSDSSHFVKFFKSKTKLTPMEFRKKF